MVDLNLIASRIRTIPDFPQKGILFRDITPLLADPRARAAAIDAFFAAVTRLEVRIDAIVGIESRGFLFGLPLADRLGVSFVPVRKPGKLPADTRSASYNLEYGQATLEIHSDALAPSSQVLIVDDVLATGGTAAAALSLVRDLGANVVAMGFLIELLALSGRAKLDAVPAFAVIEY